MSVTKDWSMGSKKDENVGSEEPPRSVWREHLVVGKGLGVCSGLGSEERA